MRHGTCRRLRRRASQSGRAARLPNHAVGARGVGRPQNRPEVMGVLDPIEHDKERGRWRLAHELFYVVLPSRLDVRNHSLMHGTRREAVELVVIDAAHRHAALLRQHEERPYAVVAALAHAKGADAPRAKRLGHRVNAVDEHTDPAYRATSTIPNATDDRRRT